MDDAQVDAYLRRIGSSRPARPDEAHLRDLQAAHLRSVPFENLSIHLGEPIVLDEGPVLDKLVNRRRGGFCYELNGAFGLLLRALGYEVEFNAARVFGGSDGSVLGPPFDHLVLVVTAGGRQLVDVGFGDYSLYPLALDDTGVQADPCGSFQLMEVGEGDIDVRRDGVPQCRIQRRARSWADFVPMCWWHQTSPHSHFTQNLVCTLATARGRVTLSGNRLIQTVDGERHEHTLGRDGEVLDAYRQLFGIELATLPRLRGESPPPAEAPASQAPPSGPAEALPSGPAEALPSGPAEALPSGPAGSPPP